MTGVASAGRLETRRTGRVATTLAGWWHAGAGSLEKKKVGGGDEEEEGERLRVGESEPSILDPGSKI